MSAWGRVRVRSMRRIRGWMRQPDMVIRVRAQVVCERVNRAEHNAALRARRYCPICSAALR